MTRNLQTLEKGWTRRKFCFVLLIALLMQLVMFTILGRKPLALTKPSEAPSTSFQILTAPLHADALSEMLVTDPTLFALPKEESFSGAAWLKLRGTQHSPAEWAESPDWLSLSGEKLTDSFAGFVRAARKPLMPVAEKSVPVEITGVPLPTPIFGPSRMIVEDEVAQRFATNNATVALSKWQNGEPLDSSVIQIAVNKAGQVISARLIERSGLEAADQEALRISAGLLFSPVVNETVAWGRVHFFWCTEPVTITNTISAVTESR